MRPDPRAAFTLGLLALLSFLCIGLGFAIDPALFSRRVTWTARFEQTATLDEGAPVYVHGGIAGRVARLGWVAATRDYQVELAMDAGWIPPTDGGVRVEEWNPLRGAFVAVIEGAACEERRAAPVGGRELATCRRSLGMIELANDILARTGAVTAQVEVLLAKLGQGMPGIGAAPGSRLTDIADNIGALTGSARALVDQLVQLTPELRRTVVSAAGMTNDASFMFKKTDLVLDALQRDTLARMNRTLDGADQLVRRNSEAVQSSVADLRYVMGASSTSVVRLVAQLEAMAANLSELTRQLRDNPGVLLHGRTLDTPPGSGARGR